MSELFNWGGETPEQRQARLQWEQELLIEQARMKAMAMQAGAVGGVGGGSKRGCTERDGLTMTWKSPDKLPEFTLIQRVFLPYTGQDESGNATFALVTDRFTSDRGEGGDFIVRVNKSGDQWLLEFVQASIDATQVQVAAQSSDLYEGWIGLEYEVEGQTLQDITATCGDQTYRRLCITAQENSPLGTFTTTSSGVEGIIPEVSEEYPSGYGGINRSGLFWDSESGVWLVGGATTVGGTLADPPTGQFESGSAQITIVEGSCTGDVPTPPEPTLVTTSDIQVDATTGWNWSEFTGGGQSNGGIAPLVIDGFPSGISALGGTPGQYGFLTTEEEPSLYNITLTPDAVANVMIDGSSYDLVSMILTVATDGTSPISGGNTGPILDIVGTITYEA